jgi:SAM-dependent methyltransferase
MLSPEDRAPKGETVERTHQGPTWHPHPGSGKPGEPDDLYASRPPWDIGRPQPAFLRLARAGLIRGRVLDAGCGTGEHTLMTAGLGLDATGIDLAASALRAAAQKAHQRALTARFLRLDARRLADLEESFDTVLDCGLFHIFGDDDRAAYAQSLRSVLQQGGRYFLLCASNAKPPDGWGRVHGVSLDQLITTFSGGWRADSIEPATIDITASPGGIPAWLAAFTRT